MELEFEIITFGGGDLVAKVFGAVGMMTGGGNAGMFSIMKFAALIGLISLILQMAFQMGKVNMSHFFVVAFIIGAMYMPRVPVIITDKTKVGVFDVTAESPLQTNIPLGIALPAAVMSQLGYRMAMIFESALYINSSDANDYRYSRTGLMFAQSLIEANAEIKIKDPRTQENLNSFWKQCVFYDVAMGRYSYDDLLSTNDIDGFLAANVAKSRGFVYFKPITVRNGEEEVGTVKGKFKENYQALVNKGDFRTVLQCREGWTDTLRADINDQTTHFGHDLIRWVALNVLGIKEVPTELPTSAVMVNPDIAYSFISGSARNQGNATVQAIMANSLKSGVRSFAAETGSDAVMQSIAITTAERDRLGAMQAAGQMARRYVPMLKNLIEVFLYAISPLVFIMAMLGNGLKVIGAYAKALLWINLWPAMFVILNFYMNFYTTAAMGSGQFGTFSLTAVGMSASIMKEHAALAGYFCMSIPFIAWSVVQFSGSSLGSMVGGAVASYERSAGATVSAMNQGNMNMDNQSHGNATANQQMLAPQTREGFAMHQGETGATRTYTPHGTATNALSSSLAGKLTTSEGSTKQHERNLSANYSTAQQTGADAQHSLGKTVGSIVEAGKQINNGNAIDKKDANEIKTANENARAAVEKAEKSYQTAFQGSGKLAFGGGAGGGGGGKPSAKIGADVGGGYTAANADAVARSEADTRKALRAVAEAEGITRTIGSKYDQTGKFGDSLSTADASSKVAKFSDSASAVLTSGEAYKAAKTSGEQFQMDGTGAFQDAAKGQMTQTEMEIAGLSGGDAAASREKMKKVNDSMEDTTKFKSLPSDSMDGASVDGKTYAGNKSDAENKIRDGEGAANAAPQGQGKVQEKYNDQLMEHLKRDSGLSSEKNNMESPTNVPTSGPSLDNEVGFTYRGGQDSGAPLTNLIMHGESVKNLKELPGDLEKGAEILTDKAAGNFKGNVNALKDEIKEIKDKITR